QEVTLDVAVDVEAEAADEETRQVDHFRGSAGEDDGYAGLQLLDHLEDSEALLDGGEGQGQEDDVPVMLVGFRKERVGLGGEGDLVAAAAGEVKLQQVGFGWGVPSNEDSQGTLPSRGAWRSPWAPDGRRQAACGTRVSEAGGI